MDDLDDDNDGILDIHDEDDDGDGIKDQEVNHRANSMFNVLIWTVQDSDWFGHDEIWGVFSSVRVERQNLKRSFVDIKP